MHSALELRNLEPEETREEIHQGRILKECEEGAVSRSYKQIKKISPPKKQRKNKYIRNNPGGEGQSNVEALTVS